MRSCDTLQDILCKIVFPYRLLRGNGADSLMEIHSSLQITSVRDPLDCIFFQAKHLNQNAQQHVKVHAEGRKPQTSQGRLGRALVKLAWKDRSVV